MNVFENIAYPLRYSKRKYSSGEIKKKVLNVLDVVHLEGYENRPATKLSGGQQQRLALARALVSEPALLLLDEPLSNLDARLRQEMRVELKRLQNEIGITTVFVPHDQTEALVLSDEIAVMKDGVIMQIGSPNDIYNHPRSEFFATFIGETNILKGHVKQKMNDDINVVDTDTGRFFAASQELMYENESVLLSIRPENIVLSNEGTSEAPFMNFIHSKVESVYFMGDLTHYSIRINDHYMKVQSHPRHKFAIGDELYIQIRPEDCVLIRQ